MIKQKKILPLRVGVYAEPNFALIATTTDENLQREYPDEGLQIHFTAGAGIILKHVRFEVSLDFSSRSIASLGSAVVRF
jgi:hypothetical protein